MNDMAYRVLALPGREEYIGRPFVEVLHDVPEVMRVFQQAFDGNDVPNRAEMRLRKTGRAMGYTLSHIHDVRIVAEANDRQLLVLTGADGGDLGEIRYPAQQQALPAVALAGLEDSPAGFTGLAVERQ